MTVTSAAWTSAGAPAHESVNSVPGVCARCARPGDLVPVRSVVSKVFTAFDDWADLGGPGLCDTCAWVFSTPSLRSTIHLISRDPAQMSPLTRTEAKTVLLGGQLGAGVALVVPLRPGRKHLLPAATWGRVCVDDAQLLWTDTHAGLLALVEELRALGFGSRMLSEPAPPFAVLKGLPSTEWGAVFRAWDALAGWRTPDNPWLPLAVHLTTPSSKENR